MIPFQLSAFLMGKSDVTPPSVPNMWLNAWVHVGAVGPVVSIVPPGLTGLSGEEALPDRVFGMLSK